MLLQPLQPPCDCFVYAVDSHSLASALAFNTFWLHFYELAGRKTQSPPALGWNHLRSIFIRVFLLPGKKSIFLLLKPENVYNFALNMRLCS